nr:amidohydrolase [Paracidobacterium acidisoli]
MVSLPLFAQSSAAPAEIICFHGNILTGVALQSTRPERVTALAIAHGEILAAGDDTSILARYKGPSTELIDLHRAFVMPGFNDAHVHLGDAAQILLSVNLTGTHSLAEMQQRIRDAAQKAAPGAWITGGGWDHTLWASKQLPTRADIDAVAGSHPAYFVRVDGHIAVVSTAALRAAGITRATPDPSGGKIDRDASGNPSGIVRETARALVEKRIPAPTPELRRKGIEMVLQDAVSHGLTSVQDNSGWQDFLVYEQLEQEGRLPLRISEWLPFDAPVALLREHQAHHAKTDRMLHTTMLKGFMDGSLGSRTAALDAPYSDDPGNSGIPRYDQAKLNQMAVERAKAGFQMGFHAIGDRAVEMALDAFAAAEQADPAARSARNRIEHSQVLGPDDFARYRQLGIIASMQPNHLLTDMSWAAQRLGPDRSKYAYAWKSFLDDDVALAFGTDYPVEPITPFRGVYAAVTRQNEAGNAVFDPEERITLGQAITAYTQGSAYAEFAETWKGILAPGYAADFVVLDRDLTAVAPNAILGATVLRTVVAGKTVYQAAAAEAKRR